MTPSFIAVNSTNIEYRLDSTHDNKAKLGHNYNIAVHLMTIWKFELLGNFSALTLDNGTLRFPGKKHQALIAMVLLSRTRRVSREQLLGLLWGSRSDDQARASLRGVLSAIKRAYQPFGSCPIEADRTHVYISDTASVEVDTDTLVNNIDESSAISLAETVRLNGSELLASLKINERGFEEWKTTEQERVRKAYRKVLLGYLNLTQDDEYTVELEFTANRMLELDDADEDAHRALMQLFHKQGNRSLALRQFEICQKKLREHYNSSASDTTVELANTIKITPSNGNQNGFNAYKTVKSTTTGVFDVALAVVPFTLPSNSDLDSDLGINIAKEISEAASNFKWFRVISTSQTFRLNLQELGPAGVTDVTGAKYILDGRIRNSEDGYVLTIELIDGINSSTVWTARFPLSRQEINNSEQINARVAGQLDVKLRSNEITYAHGLNRSSMTGYECTLLALSNLYELSSTTYEDTEALFQTAIKTSPNKSWFYSFWSLWKMFCMGQHWVDNPEAEFEDANNLARIAMKRDPEDAIAWVIAGHFQSFWEGNLDQGRTLVDTATSLNPYSSFVWMLSSATCSYCGEPKEALLRLEKAKALCPIEGHFMFMFDTAACIAHLFDRDLEQAEKHGKQTISNAPHFTNGYKHLLVALGHQQKKAECDSYLKRLVEIEANFNIHDFIKSYPFGRDEDREYFREGLTLAGAPLGNGSKASRLCIVE